METKKEIKNLLETGETRKTFLEKEEVFIDNDTGEITASNRIVVKKFKQTDEFIKFFSENLEFIIAELSGSEKNVFFAILMSINHNNFYFDNSDFRKYVASISGVGTSNLSRVLSSLEAKRVVLRLEVDNMSDEELLQYKLAKGMKKVFLVNPNLIGRGSFKELVKMRQTVVRDFDFKSMEYKREIANDFIYEGMSEIIENPHHYSVKSIEQKGNSEDDKYLEIGIHAKENQSIIDIIPENTKTLENKEYVEQIESKQSPQMEQTPNSYMQEQVEQEYSKSEQLRILELEELNLKTKARLTADELEIKNKELELKRIELKQALINMGKVEEALKI